MIKRMQNAFAGSKEMTLFERFDWLTDFAERRSNVRSRRNSPVESHVVVKCDTTSQGKVHKILFPTLDFITMTIKVEQEVLVVSLQERRPHQWPISDSSDDFLISKKPQCPQRGDDKIVYDDEDASSISTFSTASLSDSDSSEFDRRVSFSEDLVTDEWTRPFTEEEDIPTLYYSNEETQR